MASFGKSSNVKIPRNLSGFRPVPPVGGDLGRERADFGRQITLLLLEELQRIRHGQVPVRARVFRPEQGLFAKASA